MVKHTFLLRKHNSALPKEGLPAFVLQQDPWNDYGFQTLYKLSYLTRDEDGKVSEDFIGNVKILKAGQTSADPLLLTSSFNKLDPDYCSVGTSLDYYERIRALPKRLRESVQSGLRDVVANSGIANDFKNEKGWNVSLFRDGNDQNYIKLARGLLTGDYSEIPKGKLSLIFAMPGWMEPINLAFQSFSGRQSRMILNSGLSERVIVLVGRNGSGKSTVLSRLARIAHSTLDERGSKPLTNIGNLSPPGIGFPRIITVTFSPFDCFRLPGSDSREQKKIVDELKSGKGRFSFIGLRDMAAEFSQDPSSESNSRVDFLDDPDRVSATKLKSIQHLADEFGGFVRNVKDTVKANELEKTFANLLQDSAFAPYLEKGITEYPLKTIKKAFLLCSTGHKIVALTVAGLIARLEPSSLVLFDEPETHLHPPLLAGLMHSLRKIIENNNSYCILATHSPVVVQESMATHVKVIRRDGEITLVTSPKGETFGESVGLITSDVFGMNSDVTDYHRSLDKLIEKYPDLDEIEELFLNGQMSYQARAYVMARSLQLEQDNSDVES